MTPDPDAIERGRKLFAVPARFVMGVVDAARMPEPGLPEIAFAGRSNAGKSSLINALTGIKGLARASNRPGRTQELNVFDVAGRLTLVDMPGYGFADAPKARVRTWQALMRAYLRGRASLTRVFVLIDARHGLLAADREMLALLDDCAVPYQAVLTKIDKCRSQDRAKTIEDVAASLRRRAAALPAIHATSSETAEGIAELRAEIAGIVG